MSQVQNLQDSIDIANDRIKSASARREDAVKELRALGTCDHKRTRTHEEDRDNGYGKWWKQLIETCDYCASRRPVYIDHTSGSWQTYEAWLRMDA